VLFFHGTSPILRSRRPQVLSRGRTIFKECGVNISLGSSRTSQGHDDTLVLPWFYHGFYHVFIVFFALPAVPNHEFVAHSEPHRRSGAAASSSSGTPFNGNVMALQIQAGSQGMRVGAPEGAGSYGEVAESSWLRMLRMLRMWRKRRWFCCFFLGTVHRNNRRRN
jgi:hypothetical protein